MRKISFIFQKIEIIKKCVLLLHLHTTFNMTTIAEVVAHPRSQGSNFFHYFSTQFTFHQTCYFLDFAHGQWWSLSFIVHCVKSCFDIFSKVFIDVFQFFMDYEDVCINLTECIIVFILWFYMVMLILVDSFLAYVQNLQT